MDWMNIVKELIFAFTCCLGFGIVFGVKPKELYLAGLGGVIVQATLIICKMFTPNRLIYTIIGAIIACFYSEFLGHVQKTTITKFLYPSLVLMIPGDVLFNVIDSMLNLHGADFISYTVELIGGLAGIALGCMIAPMITHSKRYVKSIIS